MAVSINEMISTIESESPSDAAVTTGAQSPKPIDEEQFAQRYGSAVRAIVRDELERYLRNMAD